MTVNIKSFITSSTAINNSKNGFSNLCELSPLARTYSKDILEYRNQSFYTLECHVFSSKDTTTGSFISPGQSILNNIFAISESCIQLSQSLIQPYDLVQYKTTIINNFFNVINNIIFGEFVTNGPISLPSYITFNTVSNDIVTVYYSDEAFRNLYDETEIVVVPPVLPIDSLFNSYNQNVENMLNNRLEIITRINAAIDKYPQTQIKTLETKYVNAAFPSVFTTEYWYTIVYGRLGNNIDLIKEAIINYITANSTRTLAEWKVIFPTLFEKSEFYILPRWDKLSVINNTNQSSLYGSILNVFDNITFTKTIFPSISEGDIITKLSVLPVDFKTVMLLSLCGEVNSTDKLHIQSLYTDYLPVNTLSLDFSRMTTPTQEWCYLLKTSLIHAEQLTTTNTVPNPYSRVIKNGLSYIVFEHNDSVFYVLSKNNTIFN